MPLNIFPSITFATFDGTCYVAGSGNYFENTTISVPDNYLDDFIDMGAAENNKYYYKKYNDLLTDDVVDSMSDVSDSVKSELKKLNNAIENTKNLAEKVGSNGGAFNYGDLYGYGTEYSFSQRWSVSNCGEVWSAREAILNGVKFEELSYYTVSNITGIFKEFCENCQHTFGIH